MSIRLQRWLLALVCIAGLSMGAAAQAPVLEAFTTPEKAAVTLTEALRKDDDKTISMILGAGWRDLVPGTRQDEDETRAKYLAAWDESHRVVLSGDDKARIEVGKTGFLMAIPLVKDASGWRFDVEEGQKEIEARFIGRNELRVVQSLLALVDAQQDYAAMDPMKVGVPTYARRLLSTPGKKDGLYWESKPGEADSPLGPLIAKAQRENGPDNGYYGYNYRLLYGQGPDAPGGAYSYIVNGRMIGGFAAIAWPVRYDETGVMTFIVSHSGDVYEKDLGPDTVARAAGINLFNPDNSWEKADMTPP